MNEEVKSLDIQLIATLVFIGSLSLSYYLTYTDKIELISNQKMISESSYYKLSVFNRTLVVVLSFIFLYTNIRDKKTAIEKGSDLEPSNLQIAASELSILAAIIVLYVVITSGNYSVITTTGNPNL